jgi:hypothetical protein
MIDDLVDNKLRVEKEKIGIVAPARWCQINARPYQSRAEHVLHVMKDFQMAPTGEGEIANKQHSFHRRGCASGAAELARL